MVKCVKGLTKKLFILPPLLHESYDRLLCLQKAVASWSGRRWCFLVHIKIGGFQPLGHFQPLSALWSERSLTQFFSAIWRFLLVLAPSAVIDTPNNFHCLWDKVCMWNCHSKSGGSNCTPEKIVYRTITRENLTLFIKKIIFGCLVTCVHLMVQDKDK